MEEFLSLDNFPKRRVFLRASKVWRGFWARAFQKFGHKKASKPVNFETEKSEGKKTYGSVKYYEGLRGGSKSSIFVLRNM